MLKRKLQLSYSGLFFGGANFPKFPKWAHDSKIYCGLLTALEG